MPKTAAMVTIGSLLSRFMADPLLLLWTSLVRSCFWTSGHLPGRTAGRLPAIVGKVSGARVTGRAPDTIDIQLSEMMPDRLLQGPAPRSDVACGQLSAPDGRSKRNQAVPCLIWMQDSVAKSDRQQNGPRLRAT